MIKQNGEKKETVQEEELKIVDRRHHLSAEEPTTGDTLPEEKASTKQEQKQGEEQREQYLRLLADFENYRKRTSRATEKARFAGENDLFLQLFPIFDNLEKALAEAEKENRIETLKEGLAMVLKMWHSLLHQKEIETIPHKQEHFNPMFHEAVFVKESEEEEGAILEVLQKGYLRKGDLLLPAKVTVSKHNKVKIEETEERKAMEKKHA